MNYWGKSLCGNCSIINNMWMTSLNDNFESEYLYHALLFWIIHVSEIVYFNLRYNMTNYYIKIKKTYTKMVHVRFLYKIYITKVVIPIYNFNCIIFTLKSRFTYIIYVFTLTEVLIFTNFFNQIYVQDARFFIDAVLHQSRIFRSQS